MENQGGEPPTALARRMYESMVRIRLYEERIGELVSAGEVKTPCHLYIGQEAVAAGVCATLERSDSVWGGHRSHGHYLAKGGDGRAMMAEIFGKATGCSRGRGGSMHLCAPEVGIFGTVPLVAATIPLAAGAALAAKLSGERSVAAAFLGDGATEEGHFHETVNLAALYSLPMVFVCENNLYSSHMHILQRRRRDNICQAAELHGIAGVRLDGNDAVAVFRAAAEAVDRARDGLGPTLLECRTYRWRGHVGASWDMDVGLKRRDELQQWLDKDPVTRMGDYLMRRGVEPVDLEAIRKMIWQEVEEAVRYARESPLPADREVTQHVY